MTWPLKIKIRTDFVRALMVPDVELDAVMEPVAVVAAVWDVAQAAVSQPELQPPLPEKNLYVIPKPVLTVADVAYINIVTSVTKQLKKILMNKTFAIPVTDGLLSSHFGHCQEFYFAKVENNQIVEERMQTPPEHEPGLYPKWVKAQGGELVIGGGMGQKARNLFDENGVDYVVGAPNLEPRKVLEAYLAGTLVTSANTCDH